MPSSGSRADPVPRWVPPAVLAGLFVALTAASWGRWADPIIDFGREPYLSWQLLEGRVLYRDLASLFGPLSPWVNTVWFALFGASLTTLALCNLTLAALLAAVAYRFSHVTSGRLAATLATAVLLVAFVFPHASLDAANYDFVWPYTHAATHGTALLVCGVVVMAHAIGEGHDRAWAGAGVLLAATALTKPEIALAAAAACLTAVVWRLAVERGSGRGPLLLVGAATTTLALAVVVFGVAAITTPWTAVARVTAADRGFYAGVSGVGGVRTHAWRVLADAILWSGLATAMVIADRRAARTSDATRRWLVIAAVTAAGLLVARDLPGVGRSLPVLVPVTAVVLAYVARRRSDLRARLVPLVVWAAAAWVLLAKMFLDVHFHHYGFYLAMPAAILVVLVGVGVVPDLLGERTAGGGWLVRPVAVATVCGLLACSLALSVSSWRHMTVPIGSGLDALRGPDAAASPTGGLAVELTERLDALLPAGATLAVLPDGALLNFLTRRPNPAPYHQVMPPELAAFGVARVVAAYDARPPDWVVLIEWPGDEYGVGVFGAPEWGAEIVAWVERRYERVDGAPSRPGRVGFSIWCRQASACQTKKAARP